MATPRSLGAAKELLAKVSQQASTKIFEPEMKVPLESLLSQMYGKPVELRMTKLAKPHLNSDILASTVAQQLKDRRNTPRPVIRQAVWNVPLPEAHMVPNMAVYDAMALRKMQRKPASRAVGMKRTTVAKVLDEMKLKQVTSLRVEVAGRLGKRMTANRTARKSARKGLTSKGAGYMVRGVRPLHLQYALRSGKRRVGAFGARIMVGHS